MSTPAGPEKLGDATKHQQIARVREAFAGLMDATGEIDEREMSAKGIGDWSVCEVLAHIAGWTRIDTTIVRRLARGEAPFAPGEDYGTGDSRNPGFARSAAGKPAATVVDELRSAFEAFIAAAESLSEERFAQGRTAHRIIEESALAHIREHRIEIERYRQVLGAAAAVPETDNKQK
jgi:hypothetical protein